MNNILVDGTVRISSLEYYRTLEATQPGIADPFEASTLEAYTNFTKTSDKPGNFASIFQVAPGGEVQLHDVVIHHRIPGDLFIFCASRGDLPSLKRDMCPDPRTRDDHPYDACVRITDMRWLAHRMFYRGTVVAPAGLRDVKISHLLLMITFLLRSTTPQRRLLRCPVLLKRTTRLLGSGRFELRCTREGKFLTRRSQSKFLIRSKYSLRSFGLVQHRSGRNGEAVKQA
jgi:hypothetical protein